MSNEQATATTSNEGQTEQTTQTNEATLLGGDAQTPEQKQEGEGNTLLGGDTEKTSEESNEETKSQGAPENYSDFTLPEGVTISEEMTSEFKTLAKELNLSQEQAQKLVNLQVKNSQGTTDRILTDYQQTVKGWKSESEKAFGGELKDRLTSSAKALARFEGGTQVKELLNQTGLGNHPAFVRLFSEIGKMISEDTMHEAGKKGTPKSTAEIFYPNMK